jgi:3-hydroxyacyl-[acyl-carrier-protein] dehydratase
MSAFSSGGDMELIDVEAYLRQTDPFRFVDEVYFCQDLGVIRSSHRYVGDEVFFAGHFPGDPVVPGVILVESMAQSCRVWLNRLLGRKVDGFIASIERAKFTRPVRPGDTVMIEAKPLSHLSHEATSSRFCRFSCVSRCDGEEVAKVSITLYQSITRGSGAGATP